MLAPADLQRLAREIVGGWHPALGRIIDEAEVVATSPVRIRSAQRVAPWPSGPVTLLGDAIHTMSPGRGEGANTAPQGAHVLAHRLSRAADEPDALADALEGYREMLVSGFGAVAPSRDRPFEPH